MKKLITTRQGAVAYAVSPLIFMALFLVVLLLVQPGPFTPPILEAEMPMLLIPVALASIALPTLYVLCNWAFRRILPGKSGVVQLLLVILLTLLMWIPTGMLCVPLWIANLVCLARGRYPDGQPFPWKRGLLAVPFVVMIVILLSASNQQEKPPMPTAAEAFRQHMPQVDILAEIPLAEDAVLIISESGSGEFARTAEGWILRTAYTNELRTLPEYAASLVIGRNPAEGGADVVILNRAAQSDQPTPQPRDTAGSTFAVQTESLGPAVFYTWYAVVDADVPGYAVTFE